MFSFFNRRKKYYCGGEGRFALVDSSNREIAQLWYKRPSSDMILDYTYQSAQGLATEGNLRQLEKTDEKDRSRTCHAIMLRDLCIPFARKIFVCVKGAGLVDAEGKPIEQREPSDQIEYLIQWQSHILVSMVAQAFEVDTRVKKK